MWEILFCENLQSCRLGVLEYGFGRGRIWFEPRSGLEDLSSGEFSIFKFSLEGDLGLDLELRGILDKDTLCPFYLLVT